VFRNWNLSHRRVNEWQMLVGGGAVSEKSGTPAQADPLMTTLPAAWATPTPEGEQVVNGTGWLGAFQKWLEVAGRPGANGLSNERFRQGDPTNRELSEAVAFLFDLPLPPRAP
jgi:hypothetical protein